MSHALPRGASLARAPRLASVAPRPSLLIPSRLGATARPAQAAPKSSQAYSQPPVPPPSKSPEELASLHYFVRRTPSAQLPVYRLTKSGGTRHLVLLKKVDGDRRKMVEDLASAREIPKEEIRINPTTQHIETKVTARTADDPCLGAWLTGALKGTHYKAVKSWLLERGF